MQQALEHLFQDEILKSIIDSHGHPVIQKRDEGYASMCHIILEQQVSIASAKACYEKIRDRLGDITPEIIAETDEEALRACGVSRQKTRYLKELAAKVISGGLDFSSFADKDEDQVRKELLAIKGVGNWSAEVYLMFCLQSQDIIPLGDIAIVNTIRELYNIRTQEEMAALSLRWKPFRTLASYILWHHYLAKRNRI